MPRCFCLSRLSHLAERTTWPMLTAHKLQLKQGQMPTPPLSLAHTHTHAYTTQRKHKNTSNTSQKYLYFHMNTLTAVTSHHMNKKVHTQTHIYMLLSECCLLTRSSIGKRFSLPHTHRSEGKVCVRALVPPESLCVCVHTFCVCLGVWECGRESQTLWEAQTKRKKKFYNNFISIYSVWTVCTPS